MFNNNLLLTSSGKPTAQLNIYLSKIFEDTKLNVSLPNGKNWEVTEQETMLKVPINTKITIEMTSPDFYSLTYSSESNNIEILLADPPRFLYLQVIDTNPAKITIYDN